jgi:hypothetical protein
MDISVQRQPLSEIANMDFPAETYAAFNLGEKRHRSRVYLRY